VAELTVEANKVGGLETDKSTLSKAKEDLTVRLLKFLLNVGAIERTSNDGHGVTSQSG
jgi:hypothetical protein